MTATHHSTAAKRPGKEGGDGGESVDNRSTRVACWLNVVDPRRSTAWWAGTRHVMGVTGQGGLSAER